MVTRLGPLFTSGHRVHGVTASAGQKRGDVQIVNYSTLACHTHTECKGTLHGEGANPLSGHAPPVINIHIYQSIACAHTPADRLACLACHARHHSAHPARPCHHHCHASPDSTHTPPPSPGSQASAQRPSEWTRPVDRRRWYIGYRDRGG